MKNCSIGARGLCTQRSFSAVEGGRLVLKAGRAHRIFEAAKFPVSRPCVTSSNFFAKCPEKINGTHLGLTCTLPNYSNK